MKRPRQSGFTLLEVLVASSLALLALLLASRLLMESQIEMQRRLAELGNPQPRYALARLRHDLEGALAVPSLLPGWREGPLQMTAADGGRVLWRERDGSLERVRLDARGEEVLRQRVVGDVVAWRWRRPMTGLVDVQLRLRLAAVSDRLALGNRRSWRPRERDVWLRVTRRVGGGE